MKLVSLYYAHLHRPIFSHLHYKQKRGSPDPRLFVGLNDIFDN